jgi:preprotein translocase subunit SecD
MVALTGGMFLSGHTTPRLGIDLAGGTSITLTAKSNQAKAINKTNMNTAVDIIERRVNGLGVSEAEVQTQGDRNIIVDIPKGPNTAEAEKQVGTTAQLYFRPVIANQPNTPAASSTPSPSATGSASPSASSSASPSTKATGSTSSKSSAKKSSSPSPSSTTQGRAVTGALTKAGGSSASPASSASSSAAAAASPSPSSTAAAGTAVSAALQAKYAKVDCADKKQRALVAENTKPTDDIVTCGQYNKTWYKFVLGPAALNGKDVSSAKAEFDQQNGNGWIVNLTFTGGGSKKFGAITKQLSTQSQPNNEFAIVLDNDVVSFPTVSQELTGSAEIYGSFTQQSASDLANVLSYGSLPLTFEKSDVTTVSAAVGGEQLRGGLIAGAVGLALVVLYLLAYYRGLSFVAVLSLVVSAILTYTIMTLLGPAIGFALNLPAVCGAIVAIGITADSFIVFFERIRDELRDGRSLQPAVSRGWPRARRTILVSDFVSFLSAAVLFVVSVGKVQGFAFTLGLTTVLDVVVVFFFTKPLMTLLARKKFYAQGHPWSGLDPKALGVKAPLRRTRRPLTHDVKEA